MLEAVVIRYGATPPTSSVYLPLAVLAVWRTENHLCQTNSTPTYYQHRPIFYISVFFSHFSDLGVFAFSPFLD